MTNNKDKKVLNVPNLRFPEFTEEWERCSLGHVTDFVKERISTDKLTLANYVSTENMKSDFGGINPAISIPNNTNVIHYKKGDVLLSNIRPYLRKVWAANSDGGCSTDVFVFRAKSISPSFLHYIMANDTFINYVMSGAKGVKMPRGDKEQMLKYVFSIPRIEEQYKISRLLHLLDDRIATQNKIIEDLKKLKSAISERFFTSINGDVVTLADICDIVKGKQVNGEFLTDSGNYYVMNGGIEPSGYYDDYNTEANTISISEGGNSCGYVQFNTTPFWSGGHCYTIQNITNNVEKLYLYHYLKCNEDTIMKLRIGSGLPNIQKKDLAKFRVIVPIIEQQKTISAFLSLLERKVQVETDILIAVQSEKQYLLRQMFI